MINHFSRKTEISKIKAAWMSWIALGITLLMLSACHQIERANQSSQVETKPPINLPSSTIPRSQQANPSQTSTVIVSPTLTTLPATPIPTVTYTPQPTATKVPPIVFAAIGDYGSGDQAEGDVANLVMSWKPDFIITLGDNNYPNGAADHIDQAVGQFFHSYIYPYVGSFGEGADVNRFFPCLGNHDLQSDGGKPYFDYFTLPGNERYYDITWGPVHLFALDNVESEPDGVGASSQQADWLKAGLAASTSAWDIVYMHYPPYSSGLHGSTDWARWPYGEWGASAVLAGHDHTYERLEEGGLVYFVNGLGGGGIYYFPNVVEGSLVRYNGDYGALRIEATETYIRFEFITRGGEMVDSYEMSK